MLTAEEYKICALNYAAEIRKINREIYAKRAELRELRAQRKFWREKAESLNFHELFPEYEPKVKILAS